MAGDEFNVFLDVVMSHTGLDAWEGLIESGREGLARRYIVFTVGSGQGARRSGDDDHGPVNRRTGIRGFAATTSQPTRSSEDAGISL